MRGEKTVNNWGYFSSLPSWSICGNRKWFFLSAEWICEKKHGLPRKKSGCIEVKESLFHAGFFRRMQSWLLQYWILLVFPIFVLCFFDNKTRIQNNGMRILGGSSIADADGNSWSKVSELYNVINFGSLAFDQVAMNPSQVLRGGRDTKRNSWLVRIYPLLPFIFHCLL